MDWIWNAIRLLGRVIDLVSSEYLTPGILVHYRKCFKLAISEALTLKVHMPNMASAFGWFTKADSGREMPFMLWSSGCMFLSSLAVLLVIVEYLKGVPGKASVWSLDCVILCYVIYHLTFIMQILAGSKKVVSFSPSFGLHLQAEKLADCLLLTTVVWKYLPPQIVQKQQNTRHLTLNR